MHKIFSVNSARFHPLIHCRLKNQSFPNKSGKAQPIRTKFGIRGRWTCQGVTTFREFWARSAHFVQNGGRDESRGAPVFFCVVVQRTFRQLQNGRFLPNLVTKRSSVFRRGIHEDIFETFHFRGHLPQKSEIENRSNKHLTQSRLQVTECTAERYCLLHVVVQGTGSFRV